MVTDAYAAEVLPLSDLDLPEEAAPKSMTRRLFLHRFDAHRAVPGPGPARSGKPDAPNSCRCRRARGTVASTTAFEGELGDVRGELARTCGALAAG